MKTKFILSILVSFLIVLSGCSEKPQGTEKEIQFKQDQTGITTPHGGIDLTSVKERDDGRIAYVTKDGKHWTTDSEPTPDGKMRWEQPKPDREFQ